jgi:hypothetical protein
MKTNSYFKKFLPLQISANLKPTPRQLQAFQSASPVSDHYRSSDAVASFSSEK